MIQLDRPGRPGQRWVVQLGEVAVSLQQRRNCRDGYAGIGNAIGLHVGKEEQFVAQKRHAGGRAKLVLMVRRHGRRVPVFGVEDRVAHKLPQCAVYVVRARLQAGVDHCASGVSELSRIVAALHLELRQAFRRRLGHKTGAGREINQMIVVVHPVQHVVVLLCALSVGVEVARARAVRALRRGRARGQLRNVYPVSPAQRHLVDRLRARCLTGCTLLRLDLRRACGRADCLGGAATLESDPSLEPLLHAQFQVGQRGGSEAR